METTKTTKEQQVEELKDDWKYFLSKINFKDSPLDAKAITILNTFSTKLNELLEED